MSAGHSNTVIPRPAFGNPSVYVARDGVVIRLHAVGRAGNPLGDVETIALQSYDDMISLAADLLDAAVNFRRHQEALERYKAHEAKQPNSLDD